MSQYKNVKLPRMTYWEL